MSFRQWGAAQFHHAQLRSGAGNGHHVPGLPGPGDRWSQPPHQWYRRHLSGTCRVHYDERQGASITGYDEDQITMVMDNPRMMEWLVILGTPTIY